MVEADPLRDVDELLDEVDAPVDELLDELLDVVAVPLLFLRLLSCELSKDDPLREVDELLDVVAEPFLSVDVLLEEVDAPVDELLEELLDVVAVPLLLLRLLSCELSTE